MTSNCYLVVDEVSKHCICIDPASEKSEREIEYINGNQLVLDFVFLTHEHTDHTWGVNALVAAFPNAKVVCSEVCSKNLKKEFQAYFLYYFDNLDYQYTVCDVDFTIEDLGYQLCWEGRNIVFISTPGHSMGSMCINISGSLFTGDALLQSKPYINKRNGDKKMFYESVIKILKLFSMNTIVYPGHGEVFLLKDK